MKALKVLVAGMGVVIVLGLALVGYGLYRNNHLKAPAESVQTVPAGPSGAASPVAPFYASELPIPTGSRLEQVLSAGDRVVLRFTGDDGDRLVVLDPRNGQVGGTIQLIPAHR